jgi:hypothetical protein
VCLPAGQSEAKAGQKKKLGAIYVNLASSEVVKCNEGNDKIRRKGTKPQISGTSFRNLEAKNVNKAKKERLVS